jgi:hypothetical protein
MRRALLTATLAGLVVLASAAPAGAALKAIWGPSVINRDNAACPTIKKCSAFPTYRELGVDVYQFQLRFNEVAPTPPANPRDPNDPAYQWPATVDQIVNDAAANGIQPAALIQFSPPWANGGRSAAWAPNNRAFANFAYAASLRYPTITRWLVWGEPMLGQNFQPMPPGKKKGPRRYGRLLDATYVALKQASRRNLVIGGDTLSAALTGFSRPPAKFLQFTRLKNGRMPRTDLWGHNPFEDRFPNLKGKPIAPGFRGLSDVDSFWRDIKAAYGTVKKKGKKKGRKAEASRKRHRKKRKIPKLWLSEYTVISDHPSANFPSGFFVSRTEQARWLSAAYALVNRLKYVAGLGWFTLMDQPEAPGSANWGLMQADGVRKPSFGAYAAVP